MAWLDIGHSVHILIITNRATNLSGAMAAPTAGTVCTAAHRFR